MGRLRFAHIRHLRGLVLVPPVPLMLTALPADAPLFYLELMSYGKAQKARVSVHAAIRAIHSF